MGFDRTAQAVGGTVTKVGSGEVGVRGSPRVRPPPLPRLALPRLWGKCGEVGKWGFVLPAGEVPGKCRGGGEVGLELMDIHSPRTL